MAETNGIVFVRYGEEETPEAFIGILEDRLTRASIISDDLFADKGKGT